jgi:hypothetical protein
MREENPVTTIATDGKTIAADTQSLNGSGTAYPIKKLWRLPDGSILGVCGTAQDGMLAVEWYMQGEPKEKPKLEDTFGGILIRKGKIWKLESGLAPWEGIAPYTVGSGRDFALMAIHLGLTPAEAIQKVIDLKLDVGTGGKIDVLDIV